MTYNYQAFEAVLDKIKEHPEQFDMSEWCYTTKCVAGWACFLFDEQNLNKNRYNYNFTENGSKILGMSLRERDLFTTNDNEGVIQILEKLVSQKDLPVNEQQTIHEIAENLDIELGAPF